MLPRSQRLSVEQFNSVMSKGRVVHTPFFHMRVVSGVEKTRISAVAPQKIAKKAVERNKIRRKIYKEIEPYIPSFLNNVHAIVFAKTHSEDFDTKKALHDLFVKAGLLK